MNRTFVVDCETTALRPGYSDGSGGQIWELALCDRADGTECLWRMLPDLARADEEALRKNLYYERTRKMRYRDERVYNLAATDLDARGGNWSNPAAVAAVLAPMLAGATLIASNPGFDTGFIADFLRYHGHAPAWSYRLRDFASMAYGYLQATLALGAEGRDCALGCPDIGSGTHDFARALGVNPERFVLHSALGDVRLLVASLNVIEGRP